MNPSRQVLVIALSAAAVLTADVAVAVTHSDGGDKSPSAQSTRSATPSPSPTGDGLAPGSHVARGDGFTLVLPAGWRQVPLDAASLQRFLTQLEKSDPAHAATLRRQAEAVKGSHITLFAVRDGGVTFVDNVNVQRIPQVLPLATLASGAPGQLKRLGARDVIARMKTIGLGDVVEVTYGLTVGTATVQGTQYYAVVGDATYIVTFSFVQRDLSLQRHMTDSLAAS